TVIYFNKMDIDNGFIELPIQKYHEHSTDICKSIVIYQNETDNFIDYCSYRRIGNVNIEIEIKRNCLNYEEECDMIESIIELIKKKLSKNDHTQFKKVPSCIQKISLDFYNLPDECTKFNTYITTDVYISDWCKKNFESKS